MLCGGIHVTLCGGIHVTLWWYTCDTVVVYM